MASTPNDRRAISRSTPRRVATRPTSPRMVNHPRSQRVSAEVQPQPPSTHFSKLTPIYKATVKTPRTDNVQKSALNIDSIRSKTLSVAPEAIKKSTRQPNSIPSVDLGSTEVKLPKYFSSDKKSKSQASLKKPRKKVSRKLKMNVKKMRQSLFLITAFSLGVLVTGVYATFNDFSVNQHAKGTLADEVSTAHTVVKPPAQTDTPSTTTPDSRSVSTTPTTKTELNYVVAPDLPRFIKIPKLSIDAPVVDVGLTRDGAVDTPSNIYEAAWYNGSARPGDNGATFIDAHSSASGGALFGHLSQLVNGDKIQIEKGNGSIISYQVVSVQIVDRNHVDMAAMLRPYSNASKGLNLISCEGSWINSEKTLTNRVLVYTEQIS